MLSSYRLPYSMRPGRDLSRGFTRDGRPLPGELFDAALEANDRATLNHVVTHNLCWAAEALLSIAPKSSDGRGETVVPVVLSPIQRKTLRRWQGKLRRGEQILENIWKPRQVWFTAVCTMMVYLLTRFRPGFKTVIMGNNPRTNRTIADDRIKIYEKHMLLTWGDFPCFALPVNHDNQAIYSWYPYDQGGSLRAIPNTNDLVAEGGSQIRYENAKGESGATSGTNQGILFTEIGMDEPDWEKQFDLNNKTVLPGASWTFIIREGASYGQKGNPTTARALNYVWDQTEKGESLFENYFISTMEHHEYRLHVPMGEKVQPKFADPTTVRREDEIKDKVFRLADELWGLSRMRSPWREECENVCWQYLRWRWERGIPSCDSYEDFRMQYPLDVADAKAVRTTSFFPSIDINEALERAKKVPFTRDALLERVRIYKEPEVGKTYIGIFDPTDSDDGGDPAAGMIFCPEDLDVVATWEGFASVETQAEEWAILGWRYRYQTINELTGLVEYGKPALLIVEANKFDVLRILNTVPLKYPNLWRYKAAHGSTLREQQGKLGFYSDNTNKDFAANLLHSQWRSWAINDPAIFLEMAAYGRNARNQLRAQTGHDDRVTCLLMCAHWCELNGYKSEITWQQRNVEAVPTKPIEEFVILESRLVEMDGLGGLTFEEKDEKQRILERISVIAKANRRQNPHKEGFARSTSHKSRTSRPWQVGFLRR